MTIGSGPEVVRIVGRAVLPTERVFTPNLIGPLTAVVSVVVFAFYLTRTQSYNYGGNTSGPRWLFWLIPLWVLAAATGADRLVRAKLSRVVAAVLLGFGVMSAFYPAWNPWRPPWIQQLCERAGWVSYEIDRTK
jgi:hypothetical protein